MEKKRTDEEVIDALNRFAYPKLGYFHYDGNIYEDALKIIHRLTEERKTANKHDLMYWFNAYKECNEDCDNYAIENVELQKQVDELKNKETPKKVECHIKLPKDRIAGYCPTCDGTVDIELTWLVKHKGHRCSWCGQTIDLTGVEAKDGRKEIR